MKNKFYCSIMLLLVACFVPLFLMLRRFEQNIFATQISVFFIFIIFSAVTLFFLSRNMGMAWSFSLVLFSLHLMNSVYLFFYNTSLYLVLYSVLALIGFIISVYNIDPEAKKRISTRLKILKKPKKINLKKTTKKVSNKISKKKLSKKKAVKRGRKKKSK